MKELREGQVYCNHCNGIGYVLYRNRNSRTTLGPVLCGKCRGNEVLDWIEYIFGTKSKWVSFDINQSSKMRIVYAKENFEDNWIH